MSTKPGAGGRQSVSQNQFEKTASPGPKTTDAYFKRQPSKHSTSPSSPKRMRPSTYPTNLPQTPRGGAKVEILLDSASQRQLAAYTSHDDELDEAFAPVISDLSPKFRRMAGKAGQSVSLNNPSAMDELAGPEVRQKPPDKSALPSRLQQNVSQQQQQQQQQSLSPEKKKRPRGRPKGYRPSLMGKSPSGKTTARDFTGAQLKKTPTSASAKDTGRRTMRVASKPVTGTYYTGKRRGRPPKPLPPKPREVYESLDPKFVRFICEWEGCPAELHNFETLKRHVLIVHARIVHARIVHARDGSGSNKGLTHGDSGSLSGHLCLWAKCATREPGPARFDSAEELAGHVEEVHMPPVQWQAGDGPKVTINKVDSEGSAIQPLPAYLFDRDGNQVTPSIRDQKEEDLLTWRENRRKLKALLLQRDHDMPDEEESESDELEGTGLVPA